MHKQDFNETELMLLGVLDNAGTDAEADPQILLPFKDIHLRIKYEGQDKIKDALSILEKENKFVIFPKKEEAGITALGRQYLREYGQPVSPGYWRSKK